MGGVAIGASGRRRIRRIHQAHYICGLAGGRGGARVRGRATVCNAAGCPLDLPAFSPQGGIFPEISMRTVFANAAAVRRDWYVVDATDKTLGRLASQVAFRLRGKHKAAYTPHVDTGDHIVVINAEKIRVTGRKMTDKFYHHHTVYLGNPKSISLEKPP